MTVSTTSDWANKTASVTRREAVLSGLTGPHTGIWLATGVLFAVSAIAVPDSVTAQSFRAMLPFWAVLAIMAIGQTWVVQQRGIDLSIPGTVSFSAMVFVTYVNRHDASVLTGLAVVVVAAAVIGLVNGLIITRVHVTPLITTLAVNALATGAMFAYTASVGSAAPGALQEFADGRGLGVPAPAWVALILVVLAGALVSHTVWGRRFVAVGANPMAARALGIRVNRYVVSAYVASAVFAAGAAVLLVGYIQNPRATIGDPYLFQTVMAVVIGGTSLAGGRGSVVSSAVAALFLSQLGQVVLTLGAEASVQLLVQAIALAIAVVAATAIKSRGSRIPEVERVV